MGKPNSKSGQGYKIVNLVPAIIIYPSLCTPAVIFDNDELEILLLGMENSPLKSINISYQLKIDNQFNWTKNIQNLGTCLPLDWIIFDDKKDKENLNDSIIKTYSKFKGLLDTRAIDLYKENGFNILYKCRIKVDKIFKTQNRCSRNSYNLIWVYVQNIRDITKSKMFKESSLTMISITHSQDSTHEEFPMPDGTACVSNVYYLKSIKERDDSLRLMNSEHPGTIIIIEPQDLIMTNVLTSMNGGRMLDNGIYSFLADQPTAFNKQDPIQSYHPIFYFKGIKSVDIAHLADSHVCARQHLMKTSTARVIEGAPVVSPEIGPMVSVSSHNLSRMLSQIGEDPDVDIVIIGGDLIDYIKSLYEQNINIKRKVSDIWKILALDSKYEDHYQDYVDYITIYSLFLKFYRTYNKPIFVITGNHDAYYTPYGISPRFLRYGRREVLKANEGIPADHNLTIYEAILIFGNTYNKIIKAGTQFEKDKLKWFYFILTPFSDFALNLQNQCLTGMAWGEDEDVVGIFKSKGIVLVDDRRQGVPGHLPRADTAISVRQKKFFEDVHRNKKDRNVILVTHFTFVSFMNDIPMYPTPEGHIIYDSHWMPLKTDYGTFEKERLSMYGEHLAQKRDVHCILTGHSHRKGLYIIDRTGNFPVEESLIYPAVSWMANAKTIIAQFYELNKYKIGMKKPVIIVSDCAGPYPRHNKCGELYGWGSDRPSWTKIQFTNNGIISAVEPKTSVKELPRFIVALDYIDLIAKRRVIKSIQCTWEIAKEYKLKEYTFHFELNDHVTEIAQIDSIYLSSYYGKQKWTVFKLKQDIITTMNNESTTSNEKKVWKMNKAYARHFFEYNSMPFIAIKFSPLLNRPKKYNWLNEKHYNFNDYWCFPVITERILTTGLINFHIGYQIIRDEIEAQIPNFKWLQKHLKDKYG